MLLVQSPKVGKRTTGLENKRSNGDNPNYSIVEIAQSTEKSPGDLSILATSTPLVNADVKKLSRNNNNNNNNNNYYYFTASVFNCLYFTKGLSDSKSPQVSNTLLSILADLKSAMV